MLGYPAFMLLGTGDAVVVTLTIVVVLGIFYPMMYGPQAAFYSELFPTHVRYTGISFVYQFSGIFASGMTPLVLTYLLGAADGGIGLVFTYLLVASVVSAACALAIRPADLAMGPGDEEDRAVQERPLQAEAAG